MLQINIILGQIEVAIARGLVRSYSGDPGVAEVEISPGGAWLTTRPDGTLQTELGSGTYTLEITADGYRPKKAM